MRRLPSPRISSFRPRETQAKSSRHNCEKSCWKCISFDRCCSLSWQKKSHLWKDLSNAVTARASIKKSVERGISRLQHLRLLLGLWEWYQREQINMWIKFLFISCVDFFRYSGHNYIVIFLSDRMVPHLFKSSDTKRKLENWGQLVLHKAKINQ